MRQSDKMVTLEQYRCFFDDPWRSDLSRAQLNQIIEMHGFGKLHRSPKMVILAALGTMKSMPTMRSTLKRSISCCALLTVADTAADLAELGWQECPVSALLTLPAKDCLAASAPAASPRYGSRGAPPAGFSVRGRRPRSKRRRVSINMLLARFPLIVGRVLHRLGGSGSVDIAFSASTAGIAAASYAVPTIVSNPLSASLSAAVAATPAVIASSILALTHYFSFYHTFAIALSSPINWTQTFDVISS